MSRGLAGDAAIKRFKYDGHQIVALGALDLLEGLDVVVLGAVHNGKDLGDEMGFIARPLTARTCVKRFHS